MEQNTTTNWNIDPTHSEVAFKVKHMMISTVTGNFKDFAGQISATGDDFTNASFEFTAQIDSIDTKNADRDGHLKSADFFDAASFPALVFKSTSATSDTVTGDLTIKGVTKSVTLDLSLNGVAVDPYGQTKAGFEITGELNRKDFGLTWSAVTEAGNIVVSDKVKLVLDAQFIKQ